MLEKIENKIEDAKQIVFFFIEDIFSAIGDFWRDYPNIVSLSIAISFFGLLFLCCLTAKPL